MHRLRISRGLAGCMTGFALAAAAAGGGAHAQHRHAHEHGVASLEVAVDAATLTVRLESPLDDLVGFERAPRTDRERAQVADAVGRLRAADRLFHVDPAAGCVLSAVRLEAPALGLAEAGPADGQAAAAQAGQADETGHAGLEGTFVFDCRDAPRARFIDIGLHDAFKGVRTVRAQVASPQGQFKRVLRRGSTRLEWGR